MINKPAGYDTAPAYDGTRETLPPGGYVCKILGAAVEKVGAGGRLADKLVVRIDIDDGSSLSGYFMRNHKRRQQQFGAAKWAGTYDVFIETKDGQCNPFFKGFIKSVEESNTGFVWNWEEKTLTNCKVGIVFGEERYIGSDGKAHTIVRARTARSVQAIMDGVEAPPLMDRTGGKAPAAPQTETVVDDEDLPF